MLSLLRLLFVKFIINFSSEWKQCRGTNIKTLEIIGNSLHKLKKESNRRRYIYHGVSFIGGSICCASVNLITFDLQSALFYLVIFGICTSLAASAVSVWISVKEMVLVKCMVEDAQMVILNDKNATKALGGWLVHDYDLMEAMKSVMKTDIIKETKKAFICFIHKVSNVIFGSRAHALFTKLAGLLITLGILVNPPQVSWQLASRLAILVAIVMMHNCNRLVFDCASFVFKGVLAFLTITDVFIDNAYGSILPATGNIVISNAVLSMLLDVLTLFLISRDMHNGSVSKEGHRILEVVERMKDETDMVLSNRKSKVWNGSCQDYSHKGTPRELRP